MQHDQQITNGASYLYVIVKLLLILLKYIPHRVLNFIIDFEKPRNQVMVMLMDMDSQ